MVTIAEGVFSDRICLCILNRYEHFCIAPRGEERSSRPLQRYGDGECAPPKMAVVFLLYSDRKLEILTILQIIDRNLLRWETLNYKVLATDYF